MIGFLHKGGGVHLGVRQFDRILELENFSLITLAGQVDGFAPFGLGGSVPSEGRGAFEGRGPCEGCGSCEAELGQHGGGQGFFSRFPGEVFVLAEEVGDMGIGPAREEEGAEGFPQKLPERGEESAVQERLGGVFEFKYRRPGPARRP